MKGALQQALRSTACVVLGTCSAAEALWVWGWEPFFSFDREDAIGCVGGAAVSLACLLFATLDLLWPAGGRRWVPLLAVLILCISSLVAVQCAHMYLASIEDRADCRRPEDPIPDDVLSRPARY